MNLFARILSHGFALVLVALLAIGLIYRGDLFPGMELPDFLVLDRAADKAGTEPAAAEEPAGDVEVAVVAETPEVDTVPEAAAVAEDIAAEGAAQLAVPPVTTGEVIEETAPAEAAAVSRPEPATEMVPPAVTGEEPPAGPEEAVVDAEPAVPPPAAETAPQEEATVVETQVPETAMPVAPVTEEPAVIDVESPVAEQPAAAEAAAPVTTADEPAKSTYQLLAAAREAYWLRDYSKAEENYRALISLEPDNPDGYGELGNMYFSQGKWDLASVAYFEAGKRLTDQGQVAQARQLVDVLRGLQGAQADELEEYIAAKASTNP